MSDELITPTKLKHLEIIESWARDVFVFAEETLGMKAAEPVDGLRGKVIRYKDPFGNDATTILFDMDGRLVYHDLSFYTKDMFKNQDRGAFKKYRGSRYTWQQTIVLEAYNRAINTFDKDSFDSIRRWISVRSGHGIGKTAALCTIIIHFLVCFFGAQIGATANSENQLKDILLKELYFWIDKLPPAIKANIEQLDDMVRIRDTKDWFLRARVSKPDKPEALAGLHGLYVLIIADEASGIDDKTFEVMKGALTGRNFIVVYTSNPTRNEGEFFESHKKGSAYTRLHFSSRHSPIVEEDYISKMEADYPSAGREHSDEVKIRVDGEFAGVTEMDDKGWIPLFANVKVMFEQERGQIIRGAIIGVDPAGGGRDRSIVHIRDSVYLKEALNEKTSTSPDLARKVEAIRDAYECKSSDIGVEAFGIGAEVVANIQTKIGESVNGLLTDHPREGTEKEFNSYKSELAWLFRRWIINGGIIITNNPQAWLREFEKIKYKRDKQGRIMLMPKVDFKKEFGFSPDRFDAAIHTMFKENPTRDVVMKKEDLATKEMADFVKNSMEIQAQREQSPGVVGGDKFSSM